MWTWHRRKQRGPFSGDGYGLREGTTIMLRGDETQHERSKTSTTVCVSGDCLSGQDGMPGRRIGRLEVDGFGEGSERECRRPVREVREQAWF